MPYGIWAHELPIEFVLVVQLVSVVVYAYVSRRSVEAEARPVGRGSTRYALARVVPYDLPRGFEDLPVGAHDRWVARSSDVRSGLGRSWTAGRL